MSEYKCELVCLDQSDESERWFPSSVSQEDFCHYVNLEWCANGLPTGVYESAEMMVREDGKVKYYELIDILL